MPKTEQELKSILEADPGNSCFVELADLLESAGRILEAMDVCFAGLSRNSGVLQGRLTLAKLFYQLGYLPFAQREVAELAAAIPENVAVSRLLEKLGGFRGISLPAGLGVGFQKGGQSVSDGIVAEAEFEIEILEKLEE